MNNLNKYKLFIVDYDGTIIDSMGMWHHLLSRFLDSKNVKYTEDIDEISKEKTNVEALNYVYKKYFNNISYNELQDMMYSFVKNEYVNQKVKPGAEELLKELKSIGRVVLFSATATELLNDSFKTNGINKYFDKIYSASNMGTTKTNGVGYLKVIELENINKKYALVVEDVYHAILGAKNQGFDTLAIYDNQEYLDEIKKISTYYIDLKEIL